MTKPLKNRLFSPVVFMKLAGIIILIIVLALANKFGLIDLVAISNTLVTRPQIVVECFVLVTLSYAVVALRLSAVLKLINIPISYSDSFKITMLSQFSGTILAGPIGAEVARFGMLMKKSENRFTELTSVLLLDRVLGISGLMSFVVLMPFVAAKVAAGVPYLYYITAAFAVLFVLLMILFIIHKHLSTKNKQFAKELIRSYTPIIYKLLSQFGRVFHTFRSVLFNPLTLFKLVGFSVLASLLPLIGFSEIVKAFMPNVFDFSTSIMILAITILINSIGITPGGVGVGEAVFALFCFTVTGDSSLPYIETFLTIRLITIICVLPGGLFLVKTPFPS